MNFFNRELSWLEFNERVLEEAFDKSNPLFERFKFLAISASNLDEFFMIRVASILSQIESGYNEKDPAGLTPKEQIEKISLRVHEMVNKQYNCLNYSLLPSLEAENIRFIKYFELSDLQEEYIDKYFKDVIYPVLTPMAIDQSRPFPLLFNKSLNIVVRLKNKDMEEHFAFVQVPSILPRMIALPSEPGKLDYIFLEQVIIEHIEELFIGYEILAVNSFRITRNADLTIEEIGIDDILSEIEKSIKKRKWGFPVRLEIQKGMDNKLRNFLVNDLELEEEDAVGLEEINIYEIPGPLDLTMWFGLGKIKGYDHLKYTPIIPQISKDFYDVEDIFELIRKKDLLLHHPYESFDHVVDFLVQAANDPKVLAIKQTLYRVSGDSPIVKALMLAAENGKQVTVVVEIKARFDEENNINWAKRLEKAGCHVVYGLVGLKTHCKLLLVVRKEDDGIRRYVHFSTGNYNDNTAKLYTDIGMFTCKDNFGSDASALFNFLTGYSMAPFWKKLAVAPDGLRKFFIKMIDNEISNKKLGKDSKIIIKVNSVVDPEIINKFYEASKSGVKIELIVRGICCLKSGIENLSENITVRSIVGRFLEHSRIFYFENGGDPKIYLGSADIMQRNLDRRVEILFPVEEQEAKERIINIINITLADTIKARIQDSSGNYLKIDRRGKEAINSQIYFYEEAKKAKKENDEKPKVYKVIKKTDEQK